MLDPCPLFICIFCIQLHILVLEDVKNKWENSSWGRKLIVQKKRAALNDFDRFKLMLAKIKVGHSSLRKDCSSYYTCCLSANFGSGMLSLSFNMLFLSCALEVIPVRCFSRFPLYHHEFVVGYIHTHFTQS